MNRKNFKECYERPSLNILSFCNDQILMSSGAFVSEPSTSNEAFGTDGALPDFKW